MRHSIEFLRRSTALYLAATLLFAESYGRTALTVTTKDHQHTNVDTLVRLEANVYISCRDDVTSHNGNLSVNGEGTTLPREPGGGWIIHSMSIADQGLYECCVDDPLCEEIAIVSELKALSGVFLCIVSVSNYSTVAPLVSGASCSFYIYI